MCVSPLRIIPKNKQNGSANLANHSVPVPCGKCTQCASRKINDWHFRLSKQMEISSTPLFITLTYSDEEVIHTDDGLTLSKRDCQLWMKRLRKVYSYFSDKKVIYYLVGEYGSITHRPHYHCIMFNMDKPELIHSTWGKGHTYSPLLSDSGIRYVLKYISKPKSAHILPQMQKEFSLMSKGIGANFLSSEMLYWLKDDVSNCFMTLDGKFYRSPSTIRKKPLILNGVTVLRSIWLLFLKSVKNKN